MKIVLKLAAIVLLIVMIGGAVTLQSAIKDARAEQQELSKSGADVGAPQENKNAAGPTAESDELQRLREANKDLPKLRNEVRQLRRQADEMAKLRADNERLKNGPKQGAKQYPPDYIKRDAMGDAGLATPEAAVQTFFWAMTRGNYQRFKDCLSPEAMKVLADESEEKFTASSAEASKVLPGFRIADKQVISADEVKLTIELMPGVENASQGMTLKHIGNEWKLGGFK